MMTILDINGLQFTATLLTVALAILGAVKDFGDTTLYEFRIKRLILFFVLISSIVSISSFFCKSF